MKWDVESVLFKSRTWRASKVWYAFARYSWDRGNRKSCCCTYAFEKQMEWIQETYSKYEIDNLIIVGGESSKQKYPGPTVNESLEKISQDNRP